ncbi:Translation initiation factor eIF2B subunit beta [Plasmodiophora brassicae]|uniref:Translation initiation factor eIF2B subunit beta n=1 Tax=Plasmodiophora brassicae TaxID=37360 RepID=A0A0G4IWT2_PLABS|nr:hypothetical protein PBRA_007420 [Plasmodiophora brassicae]SPQ97986.1 unnamed protein product [Plasmodiophora brassicae]
MGDSSILAEFAEALRSGSVDGSINIAKGTVRVLSRLVRDCNAHTVIGLLDYVRSSGNHLVRTKPQELVIGNIVRRVLAIVRSAHVDEGHVSEDGTMSTLGDHIDLNDPLTPSMREAVELEMSELSEEIDLTLTNVTQYAKDHIRSSEVILTFGKSSSVLSFLVAGGGSRDVSVVVAESGPQRHGHDMCALLAQRGIRATLIPDSHVFAIMPLVNKVIIGTQAVLADGGILGYTGSHNIAACAQAHAVPVIVVAGLFKFSPLYAFSQDTLNAHKRPSDIMAYEDSCSTQIHIYNPAFDYVSPTYITLYITNVGPYSPSYVYRLLSESYHQADLDLK